MNRYLLISKLTARRIGIDFRHVKMVFVDPHLQEFCRGIRDALLVAILLAAAFAFSQGFERAVQAETAPNSAHSANATHDDFALNR